MSLKDAAKKEDLPETKKAFVSLVRVFEVGSQRASVSFAKTAAARTQALLPLSNLFVQTRMHASIPTRLLPCLPPFTARACTCTPACPLLAHDAHPAPSCRTRLQDWISASGIPPASLQGL